MTRSSAPSGSCRNSTSRSCRSSARPAASATARSKLHNIVGSIQERTLLDKLFRSPETLRAKISTVMDAPFPLVDAAEEVERVFPLLSGAGSSAVLVQRGGQLLGIITRADLLDFVTHSTQKTEERA